MLNEYLNSLDILHGYFREAIFIYMLSAMCVCARAIKLGQAVPGQGTRTRTE